MREGPVRVQALVWMLLVLSGCVPAKVTTATAPQIDQYRVKTVAILPFDALTTPQVTDQLGQPIGAPQGAKRSDIAVAVPPAAERFDQPTVTVPPHAPEKVTQIFYDKLRNWEGLRVLPLDEGQRAMRAEAPQEVRPEELARRVAKRLPADAVLMGRVNIYRERAGSKIGADPAVVGFEVKLLAADGAVLWVGNYYEKQRPMNEDLKGWYERGGVFVTADELANYGATELMKQFPFGGPPP
jgi:hypothetical protein